MTLNKGYQYRGLFPRMNLLYSLPPWFITVPVYPTLGWDFITFTEILLEQAHFVLEIVYPQKTVTQGQGIMKNGIIFPPRGKRRKISRSEDSISLLWELIT